MLTGAWGRAPWNIRAVLLALAVAGATITVAPAPALGAAQAGHAVAKARDGIVLRGGQRTTLSAVQALRVVAGRYVIQLAAGVDPEALAADYGRDLRIHHRYGKLG